MKKPLVETFEDHSTITLTFLYNSQNGKRYRKIVYAGSPEDIQRISRKKDFKTLTHSAINAIFEVEGEGLVGNVLTKIEDGQYTDSEHKIADGPYIEWDTNGQLTMAGYYQNNKLNGQSFMRTPQDTYQVSTFQDGLKTESIEETMSSDQAMERFIELNHGI